MWASSPISPNLGWRLKWKELSVSISESIKKLQFFSLNKLFIAFLYNLCKGQLNPTFRDFLDNQIDAGYLMQVLLYMYIHIYMCFFCDYFTLQNKQNKSINRKHNWYCFQLETYKHKKTLEIIRIQVYPIFPNFVTHEVSRYTAFTYFNLIINVCQKDS